MNDYDRGFRDGQAAGTFPIAKDAKKKRREFLVELITNQKIWIHDCEQNGKSYTGPNGDNIRKADWAYLTDHERQLRELG